MRAAIYTRVSQDRNRKGRSVSEQEAECRAFAEREGWTVEAVYSDNDRSASRYATKGRPEFERLLADLGKFDVLVTWEASRATRDLAVYASMREACRLAGVKWAYSGRVYDFDRTDDSFSSVLDIAIAEREAGDTRRRVLRAVRAQANAGKPHGRVPFGYMRQYDPATRELVAQVPHPVEAPLLIEAADRVLSGESIYSITKDFRARGIGYIADNHRIQRLLKSPTYAGKRVYRGDAIGDAQWPALIDPERWEALQAILTAPERSRFHGSEPRHLLSGVAVCGVCGGQIISLMNRGKYPKYSCRYGYCVARNQTMTDELVTAVVKNILMRPDALEAIHAEAEPDVSGAAQELRELEARLEGLYTQAADGSLSASGLAKVESAVLAKIEAARARLRSLRTPQRLTIPDPAATAERWDTLPLIEQREIIRALMEVRIMPARAKGVKFEPASIEISQRF